MTTVQEAYLYSLKKEGVYIEDEMEKDAYEHRAKEMELWKQFKKGDTAAKRELLKSLHPIIKKYLMKFKTSIPYAVMEAKAFNIVSDALPNYNPNKSQMNTYITTQLQQIHRFVADHADMGYIPEARQAKITLYKNTLSHMRDTLNREPSAQELAAELNWPESEVSRIRMELRGTFIEDPGIMASFTKRNTDMDNIEFVYNSLAPQDQSVMECLMGLHGREPMTLEETANQTGLTVSQIRYVKDRLQKKFEEVYGQDGYIKIGAVDIDENTHIDRIHLSYLYRQED